MAALTKKRMTRPKSAKGMDFPVAAGAVIFTGAYVVLSGGFLHPATAAPGLRPTGRATSDASNALGNDGDVACHVDFMREKTLFPFIGNAGEFRQTDVGATAFLLDDQTVTTDAAGHTAAGVAWRVALDNEIQTVWVEV